MEFENRLRLSAPLAMSWELLTDIERVAPCVPGFQLAEIEGDEYRGVLRVKVGAVLIEYDAALEVLEQNADTYSALMLGRGRERRGHGGVNARIASVLVPISDQATDLSVTMSLDISGRIAGFGRSIIGDVSKNLMAQFVRCLESRILAGV